MTAEQVARVFHAKRVAAGRWRAECPVHGGRYSGPLSIGDSKKGVDRIIFTCHGGCDARDVLATKGLTVGDLYPTKRTMTPFVRQQMADHDRLAILERRHGLFIMLGAVEPEKRNYWAAAERNTLVEIRDLRRTLFPVEAYYLRRYQGTYRVIREYGFDELWECLPE